MPGVMTKQAFTDHKKLFSGSPVYQNRLRDHIKSQLDSCIQKEGEARTAVPDSWYDLIEKMLLLNFNKRIDASQALNHPFFTEGPAACKPEELPFAELLDFHEHTTKHAVNRRQEIRRFFTFKHNKDNFFTAHQVESSSQQQHAQTAEGTQWRAGALSAQPAVTAPGKDAKQNSLKDNDEQFEEQKDYRKTEKDDRDQYRKKRYEPEMDQRVPTGRRSSRSPQSQSQGRDGRDGRDYGNRYPRYPSSRGYSGYSSRGARGGSNFDRYDRESTGKYYPPDQAYPQKRYSPNYNSTNYRPQNYYRRSPQRYNNYQKYSPKQERSSIPRDARMSSREKEEGQIPDEVDRMNSKNQSREPSAHDQNEKRSVERRSKERYNKPMPPHYSRPRQDRQEDMYGEQPRDYKYRPDYHRFEPPSRSSDRPPYPPRDFRGGYHSSSRGGYHPSSRGPPPYGRESNYQRQSSPPQKSGYMGRGNPNDPSKRKWDDPQDRGHPDRSHKTYEEYQMSERGKPSHHRFEPQRDRGSSYGQRYQNYTYRPSGPPRPSHHRSRSR